MATRALQEWARLQVLGYPGVEVTNMSSSFRDGLAFCAIIHRHRPELIDFDSLSKENVYENNRLAFEVAEQELGIPALLDPEDMVAMRVPDRLSILTYVSQLYNYFTNQTHAGVPPSMKRPAGISPSEPSIKKPVTVSKQVLLPNSHSSEEVAERPRWNTLSSTCAICSKHVHLVQRYLVDGKLYHRNCFRCKECSSTLLPGAYKPGSDLGTFVCTHHRGQVTGRLQRPLSVLQSHQGSGSLPAQTLSSATPLSLHYSLGTTEGSEDDKGSLSLEPKVNEEEGVEPSSTQEGLSISVKQLSAAFSVSTEKSHPSTGTASGLLELSNSSDYKGTSEPEVESHLTKEARRSSDSSDPKEQAEHEMGEQLLSGLEPKLQESQNKQQQATNMDMGNATENVVNSNTSGTPARYVNESQNTNFVSVNKTTPDEKLKPPIPVPRKTIDSVSSPIATPHPVPRPRISFGGGGTSETSVQKPEDSLLVNGGVTEQTAPIPKPRDRPQTFTERKGEDNKPKDHPWMALVNSEVKRRPAPPRPGAPTNPSSTQQETTESVPLNPFEVDEEEETSNVSEKVQSAAPMETTPKSNHPWYGIQPANSPRSKKRPAPPAPNASPSASRSLQYQTHNSLVSEPSPSPSLSMESISGNSAKSTPELHRKCEAEAADSPATDSRSPATSNGSPIASETALSNTESPTPSSYHRPPPKPPVSRSPRLPAHPSPETNRVKLCSTDLQPKSSCKENPFDRKSSPTGLTAPPRPRKGPKPARPPAPGHGFPLIKRKVHADQYIPEENIQGELEQLEQSLDELEHHGVALEEKLRSCDNDEDEDDLLVDWFKLIHEKHMLVRRESELVYTFKQQNLEERQADVEYELRCLLNKPEKDWTDEDRAREAELMQELITVIEQRNAIINSLDEDRQREEEEDKLLAAMIKNKGPSNSVHQYQNNGQGTVACPAHYVY
ncbi:MICAL-like protein 1 isoform X2 [Stegostoma tigrinum]|uniref:MICAL-like protein 1 isoform X2 n=1 Tax=Stegostoma tigrinum TaxID=3053191 RepID=UPI00202B4D80|nr:MICAL-like protein 1 isoform X2 [Stegostoma tigrinum]